MHLNFFCGNLWHAHLKIFLLLFSRKINNSVVSSSLTDSTIVENDRDDSAFHEPEYSNPASFESRNQDSPDYSPEYQNHAIVQRQMKRLGISSVDDLTEEDFIPDYEEVDPVQVEQLRQALKRNSFHKEVVNTTISSSLGLTRNEKYADNTSATKERIMQALIYCIHKVSGKWWKKKKG